MLATIRRDAPEGIRNMLRMSPPELRSSWARTRAAITDYSLSGVSYDGKGCIETGGPAPPAWGGGKVSNGSDPLPMDIGYTGGSQKGQKARKAEKVERLRKEAARRARPHNSIKEARAASPGAAEKARLRRAQTMLYSLNLNGLRQTKRLSQENATSAVRQVTSGQTVGNA